MDTSDLILHCPATDSLSLYDLWSRPWGVAGFWGTMVFRYAPIPRKGLGNQQQAIFAVHQAILPYLVYQAILAYLYILEVPEQCVELN